MPTQAPGFSRTIKPPRYRASIFDGNMGPQAPPGAHLGPPEHVESKRYQTPKLSGEFKIFVVAAGVTLFCLADLLVAGINSASWPAYVTLASLWSFFLAHYLSNPTGWLRWCLDWVLTLIDYYVRFFFPIGMMIYHISRVVSLFNNTQYFSVWA